MMTQIDPDLPLCWEDADTVRIGFERAIARVHQPTAAAQRLIGALCTGIDSRGFFREARRVGATSHELRGVLDALRPALIEQPATHTAASKRPLRLVISDDGRGTPGLREALGATEPCDVDTKTRIEDCDLVVHVERFLEPLERAQRWLTLGLPHLLVRFTDRAVHVGPIVEAAGAPCHSCVSLARVASDRALPALATQLYGKVPHSETAAAAEFAAVYCALLIRQWRAGETGPRHTRWALPVRGGLVTEAPSRESVVPHPGCACGDSLDRAFETAPVATPQVEVS